MGEQNEPEQNEPELKGPERRRNVSEWRKLTMFVLCLLVFTGGGFYYANWKAERAAREGERRWCSLLGTMDSAYQEAPPSTATGRKMAEDIHELHKGFQCPKAKP